MKKHYKQAFTLVELLAVIVIIAIVGVISVPIITGVLNDARKNSFKNSAYGIIEAANLYYSEEILDGNIPSTTTFTVSNNKLVSGDKELSFTGPTPVGNSWVKINKDGKVALRITDGKYYLSKDYNEIGVVLAYEEIEALTREELISDLSELRNGFNQLQEMVANQNSNLIDLTDNFNEYKESINNSISIYRQNAVDLNSNYQTLEETVTINNTNLTNSINNLNNQTVSNTNSITTLTNTITTNNTNLTNSINNLTNIENNNNIFLKTYPIGSIYITTSNVNPSTIYGGTWESYGNGKTLVGVDTAQTEFNTVNKTGGEKTHTLLTNEIPTHNHTFTTSSTSKSLTGNVYFNALGNSLSSNDLIASANGIFSRYNSDSNGTLKGHRVSSATYRTDVPEQHRRLYIDATHTHSGTTSNVGSNNSHNNLQPYITVYMWKRTA